MRCGAARSLHSSDVLTPTLPPLPHLCLQCLYSNGGYTYLDVRSSLEVEEVGKVKDSVNIPWVICSRVWDPQEQKKVIKKEDNTDFIAQARNQLAGQQAGADLCSSNRQACSQAVSQAGWQSGRHAGVQACRPAGGWARTIRRRTAARPTKLHSSSTRQHARCNPP